MNNTIIETTDEKPCGNFTVLPLTVPPEVLEYQKDLEYFQKRLAAALGIPKDTMKD